MVNQNQGIQRHQQFQSSLLRSLLRMVRQYDPLIEEPKEGCPSLALQIDQAILNIFVPYGLLISSKTYK